MNGPTSDQAEQFISRPQIEDKEDENEAESLFYHNEITQNQYADKIKALRSRIRQDRNNNFVHLDRNDDAFLLLFLRARRFKVDASFELLCNYKQFRDKNASIYQNLSTWQLHHVLEDGFPCVLPYSDQKGAKIMVIFAGGWDTDTYGTVDILKAFILTMERLIEDDEVQVNGIITIADFSGWTATHASQLSLSFIRQVCSMFQDHYPARILGFHFVNEPWYVRAGLTLLKPFINEKIWKRIHVHGNNMATLHNHCHQDLLPAEFGGNKPAVNREYWARVLLDADRTSSDHVYGENPFRKTSVGPSQHDWEIQEIPHVIKT